MAGRYLSDEITFQGPIPADIGGLGARGRVTQIYEPLDLLDAESLRPLDNNQLLRYLLKNADIDILLRTLGNAFFPRIVTIGTTPTEIISPNRYPRGYVLINANTTVSGVTTSTTVFPAGTVFPVGTTNSAAISVGAFRSARFFMNITEASAGSVSVNAQSQDPVTSNWMTTQSDLFGGAMALGNYYASIGDLGVDSNMRLEVVVTGDSFTGSIGAVLKEAYGATIAGPSVFLGNEDVSTFLGYPLLSGTKETFYLRENTPLFGIATAAVNLNLFELQ